MKTRVVDLSHPMIPGKMNRGLDVKLLVGDTRPWGSGVPDAKPLITDHPVDERNTVPVPDGNYFLMAEVSFNTHTGTHIEIPYHCLRGEQDFTEYPLENLCGPAVFLRLRGFAQKAVLELEDVKAAATAAGGVQQGDMVFLETGWDRFFFDDEELYLKAPYPSYEAVKWIVSHDIRMFGMDIGFIESPRNPRHDNHLLIMESGASLIENMAHLDRVQGHRAMVYCLPLAIKGADSMPVRIVAIEGAEA